MKYYFFALATNLKEVGSFPHSDKFIKMGNISENMHKCCKENVKIELPVTILSKKAKPTTIINIVRVPINYFLSVKKEFLEIINQYNISRYKYWEIEVILNHNP